MYCFDFVSAQLLTICDRTRRYPFVAKMIEFLLDCLELIKVDRISKVVVEAPL